MYLWVVKQQVPFISQEMVFDCIKPSLGAFVFLFMLVRCFGTEVSIKSRFIAILSNSKSVMKPFILPLILIAEKKPILLCGTGAQPQIINIHLVHVHQLQAASGQGLAEGLSSRELGHRLSAADSHTFQSRWSRGCAERDSRMRPVLSQTLRSSSVVVPSFVCCCSLSLFIYLFLLA